MGLSALNLKLAVPQREIVEGKQHDASLHFAWLLKNQRKFLPWIEIGCLPTGRLIWIVKKKVPEFYWRLSQYLLLRKKKIDTFRYSIISLNLRMRSVVFEALTNTWVTPVRPVCVCVRLHISHVLRRCVEWCLCCHIDTITAVFGSIYGNISSEVIHSLDYAQNS